MIMTDDNDYRDSYDTSNVIKSKLMNSKNNIYGNKKIITEIISILIITIMIIIINNNENN